MASESDKIKKDDIIEEALFSGTIEEGKLLLGVLNALEKEIKTLAIESTKYFAISVKTLADLEQRKAALDNVNTLEKTNTQILKQKAIVEASLQKEEAALEKLQQSKIKTLAEQEKLEKQRIETDRAQLKIQKDLEKQGKKNIGVTENSTQALRRMQQELSKLPAGSKEFNELAKKAGALKDKIDDAKDAVKAFSSESKLTNARTLFGQIGTDLANMNFSDAADKARTLATVVRSMTFAEAAKGVKDFGVTLLNLGKAMLLNPFTLVATAVVGLGVALWNLKDRVKIIGDAFDFFGNIISGSIQLMKDFTDWTGLTAFAAEEKAERIKKAAEVEQDAIKRRYELEVSLAKIAGKETLGLERLQLLQRQKYLKRRIEQEQLSGEELEKVLSEQAKIEDELIINKEMQRQSVIKKLKDNEASNDKNNSAKKIQQKKDENEKLFELNTDFITNQNNFYLSIQKIQEDNIKAELDAQQKKIDFNRKKILDQQELDKEMLALAEKWQQEIDKDHEEAYKKQQKFMSQLTKGISDGLKKQADIKQQADQQDIDRQKRNIDVQSKLAAAGKENVLAEELASAAKAEEKKIQDAKKAAKQQETLALIETFTKTLQAGLKSDKPFLQAFGEALASEGLVSATFSKLFSGFYEGTEAVKSTDGINIGTSRDSQVVRVNTGERILGVKDSADIPAGMTNKEVVMAAQMYMNPELKSTFFPVINESVLQQQNNYDTKIYEMTSEVKAMRKAFESRPVPQTNLARLGEWTDTIRRENVNTIIHHKNSNKRPSLRLNG